MDKAWYEWTPSSIPPPVGNVTPETFNWRADDALAPETPTTTYPRPTSVLNRDFELAPQSVRKAWINTDDDPLYPSPKKDNPFSFARMDSDK